MQREEWHLVSDLSSVRTVGEAVFKGYLMSF